MAKTSTSPRLDPEESVRILFGGLLEGWATDCLRLRRTGLDRPSERAGNGSGTRSSGLRFAGALVDGAERRPRWVGRRAA